MARRDSRDPSTAARGGAGAGHAALIRRFHPHHDVVVHETDIRAALGLPRATPSAALSLALSAYSFSLENRIRTLGLPGLVVVYGGKKRCLGESPEAATLTADRHELVRVLAGRRTRDQILELDWAGDPSTYVDVLSEYGPTTIVGID